MTRRLPQRLLAIELRTEIDRALRGDRQAERRAVDLALINPVGTMSSHVLHNLRPRRVAWLTGALALARGRPLSQVDPKPLVGGLTREEHRQMLMEDASIYAKQEEEGEA